MATRRHRLLVAGVAASALLAGTTTVLGSSAVADRTRLSAERVWSGFRIDANDRASGSWLGAWKLGRSPGRVVYRIDPAAQQPPHGFGRLELATRVPGPGRKQAAGTRATARAAWILSKYGDLRYEIQSAAVDVAVLHLLAGGDFRLNGSASKARLRETGEAERIKRFAKIMLDDSARRAGPYRLSVGQLGETAIGDPVQLGVQVVGARSGTPLASVPVSIRVGGGAWHSAGETDDAGRVAFDHVGAVAGPHRVTARVGRVPEHHLLLMEPRRQQASRVAVAGRKHVLAAPTTASVKARPGAVVAGGSMISGNRTMGSFRITDAYGSAAGHAIAVLRGPFGSVGQATCQRKAVSIRRVPVAGNGRYQLPRIKVGPAGVYIWHIVAPGNVFNLDAAACDGAFRVRPRG